MCQVDATVSAKARRCRSDDAGYRQRPERTVESSGLNREKGVGDEVKKVEGSECQAKRIWFYF